MIDNIIQKKINKYNWYHSIELKPGIKTNPVDAFVKNKKFSTYESKNHHWMQRNNFKILKKINFKNKKVLDIGCRDGLFSFYAEKMGASKVIGIDNDLSKGATEFLIPYFNSKIKMFKKNVYDLKSTDFGKFDIILFFGVLYHLRYPFFALKKISEVLNKNGLLLIETAIFLDSNKKAMLFCPTNNESAFEETSCTFFNTKGLIDTLRSIGLELKEKNLYPQNIKYRIIKNLIKFFLRIINKKKIFGIKTSHVGKYDQHIGDKVEPITRGIFIAKLNKKLIKKEVENYWENHHNYHSR
jgi:2-polyprenyl-3-methyl-5-hydroxy-6-metoxy-1,4-benzoquinol methylase